MTRKIQVRAAHWSKDDQGRPTVDMAAIEVDMNYWPGPVQRETLEYKVSMRFLKKFDRLPNEIKFIRYESEGTTGDGNKP